MVESIVILGIANPVSTQGSRTPMTELAIRNRASCLSIVQCADSEGRNAAEALQFCVFITILKVSEFVLPHI